MVLMFLVDLFFFFQKTAMISWIATYLPQTPQYKFVTQIMFTLVAAVLTELVGNVATVSIMLPVTTQVVSVTTISVIVGTFRQPSQMISL